MSLVQALVSVLSKRASEVLTQVSRNTQTVSLRVPGHQAGQVPTKRKRVASAHANTSVARASQAQEQAQGKREIKCNDASQQVASASTRMSCKRELWANHLQLSAGSMHVCFQSLIGCRQPMCSNWKSVLTFCLRPDRLTILTSGTPMVNALARHR